MILEYFKDKKIALFGNSASLIHSQKDIRNTKYDIYVRLNKGTPIGNEHIMGSQTDVLGLSLNLSKDNIEEMFGEVKLLIYLSIKNRGLLNEYLTHNCLFYPESNWAIMYAILGHRPSSGLMMIDFLWCYTDFKELHLHGFDFWKSENSYTGIKHVGPHDPLSEKEYVDMMVTNDKRIFHHE